MIAGRRSLLAPILVTVALIGGPRPALSQEIKPTGKADFPGSSNYAPAASSTPLAQGEGKITVAAKLTDEAPELTRGLVWRIFGPDAGPDGKLPLVASAQGGTSEFQLVPGSYLVHASFGRAGATSKSQSAARPSARALSSTPAG